MNHVKSRLTSDTFHTVDGRKTGHGPAPSHAGRVMQLRSSAHFNRLAGAVQPRDFIASTNYLVELFLVRTAVVLP